MKSRIIDSISTSIKVKQAVLEDQGLIDSIEAIAENCTRALRDGNKILLCGNGGSAADAQHIAAELSGRFKLDRQPLFAEALHVNSSYVTAVANDYNFEEVYRRAVEGLGRKGDVLIAISTSGNSQNIILAADQARSQGMIVVGLTGASGGKLVESCDIATRVPSSDTPRIQEAHILIGHIICELVEASLFGDNKID